MVTPTPSAEDIYDVAIVGGGIAGLAAAWRLRHRRCVVLEADARPGGRLHSIEGSGVPLNLGAHMVPGAGSAVGGLVAELGLEARPLPPNLFGLDYRGRRHLHVPTMLLPFALRLSPTERLAFIRMGATLRLGARRSVVGGRRRAGESADDVRARQLAFEDERTLADAIGPLPERVDLLFRGLTERNGADPADMSAGHGLRSFANVWAKTAPGTNLVGGSGVLPAALASRLGSVFRPMHAVLHARPARSEADPPVTVTWRGPAGEGAIGARTCILATPAPVTRAIAPDLTPAALSALDAIRYGAFLTMSIALDPMERVPWEGTYAIATPDLGFSVLFNHDAMRRERNGHSVMLFRGARGASRGIEEEEPTLVSRWLEDLETRFPETRGRVRDVAVSKWRAGAPFAAPGRSRLQPALDAVDGPFLLAGDYLEFPNMEAAAGSGLRAAERAERLLDAPSAPPPSRTPP